MPSLFHPRGLFHFFWWPSDSRLFSQGNEQIWWNDLKAVLDAFFIRGQRGCSWGCGERGTVPCISTNMQQPWGTEPPGEVEPPLYALSGQDRDWQHISTKMKKKKKGGGLGILPMFSSFLLLLFIVQVPLIECLIRNCTPSEVLSQKEDKIRLT